MGMEWRAGERRLLYFDAMESSPAPMALEGGRALLDNALDRGLVAIACSDDIGELCAALLLEKAVARRGGRAETLVAGRADDGEGTDEVSSGAVGGETLRGRLVAAA